MTEPNDLLEGWQSVEVGDEEVRVPPGVEVDPTVLESVVRGLPPVSGSAAASLPPVGPAPEEITRQSTLAGPARGVGAPVMPDERLGLGYRFLAGRGDTLQERANLLSQRGFTVQIVPDPDSRFPGRETLMIQGPDDEFFYEFNDPTQFTGGDVAEFLGRHVTAENVFSLYPGLGTGRGLVKGVLVPAFKAGAGAAVGRVADASLEHGLGIAGEEESFGEYFSDLATSVPKAGAAAAVGELASKPVLKGMDIVTGRAGVAARLDPNTRHAIQLSEYLSTSKNPIPAVTPGTVPPTFRRLWLQSAGTSARTQAGILDNMASPVGRIVEEMDNLGGLPTMHQLNTDTLEKIVDRWTKEIQTSVRSPIAEGPRKVGKDFDRGLLGWYGARKEMQDRLYADAFEMVEEGGLTFNIRETVDLARQWRYGTLMRRAQVRDSSGRFTQTQLDPIPGTMSKELLHSLEFLAERNPLVKKVKATDRVTGQDLEFGALEQVMRVRTTLYNLAYPNPGKPVTWQNEMAQELYQSLTRAIENPSGGNAAFRRQWRKANAWHKDTDRIQRELYARLEFTHGRLTNPSDVGRMLTMPGNEDFTIQAFRIAKEQDGHLARKGAQGVHTARLRRQAQDAIINDPLNITRRMDKLAEEPHSFRLIFSEAEEAAVREYGQAMEKLQSSSFVRMAQTDEVIGSRAIEVVTGASDRELVQFLETVGGKDSALGRAAQVGVIKHLLDNSTRLDRGKVILDPKKWVNEVDKLDKEGRLKLLLNDDTYDFIHKMTELQSYWEAIDADFGASLHAASLAQEALSPLQPRKFIRAQSKILKNELVARLIQTRMGRVMIGAVASQSDRPLGAGTVRRMGIAINQAAKTMEEDSEEIFGPGDVINAIPSVQATTSAILDIRDAGKERLRSFVPGLF